MAVDPNNATFSTFERMRRMSRGQRMTQDLRPQERPPAQMGDAIQRGTPGGTLAPQDRELDRLRRAREVQAKTAYLRRRQAARSGDVGALEDASLGVLDARNDLLDVGLAASGREQPNDMVQADLANRRRALMLRRRSAGEGLADAEGVLERSAMERDRMLTEQRTRGELTGTEYDVAAGSRPGIAAQARNEADLGAIRSGAALSDERYRIENLTPLERRRLMAEATAGAEGADAALSDQRFEAQTMTPLERRLRITRGQDLNAQATETAETRAMTRDSRQLAAIEQADADRIIAETRTAIAEGRMDSDIGRAIIEAATDRDRARLESFNVQTAGDIAMVSAGNLVRRAEADSRSQAAVAEGDATLAERRAERALTSDALQDSPSSGIVRQASENPEVLESARTALAEAAAVFDPDTPGRALAINVFDTGLPTKLAQARDVVSRLVEDANSDSPEQRLAARREAQALLRTLPVRGEQGYSAKLRGIRWSGLFQRRALSASERARAAAAVDDLTAIANMLEQITGDSALTSP